MVCLWISEDVNRRPCTSNLIVVCTDHLRPSSRKKKSSEACRLKTTSNPAQLSIWCSLQAPGKLHASVRRPSQGSRPKVSQAVCSAFLSEVLWAFALKKKSHFDHPELLAESEFPSWTPKPSELAPRIPETVQTTSLSGFEGGFSIFILYLF